MKKFGLDYYTNPNAPAIFFGCYRDQDYQLITEHKGLGVLYWGGSDSGTHQVRIPEKLKLLNKPNIKHISGSAWCSKDLEEAGLKYTYLPITVIDNDAEKASYKAEPLGNKIYVYSTESYNPEFYGASLYYRLMNELGEDKFIITHARKFNRQELLEAYKKSFVGLRLVQHDGISETVVELGLLGRRVVYNGAEPNALHYKSYDDIKRLVLEEMSRIGQTDYDISEAMRRHIDVPKSWLDTSFWNEK
jgi:hypothetical protein